jgi:RNA polymerase sigma-70 factor (ECF subfamily)
VSDDSDLELLARFRAGDAAAFNQLLVRHQPWIQRVCQRFLRSPDAARDAAQDVLARAFEKIDTFRGDNFAGWLKAIAVNICLNIIDREKRWAPLDPAAPIAADLPDPDAQLIGAERSARARRIIERLSPKQKIVFCMKYLDGCSYHEIEQLTGFTANEVKSYLQNARRNFENWWRSEDQQAEGAWPKTI